MDVVKNNGYRRLFKEQGFYVSHLKTFRITLFNKISVGSLKFDEIFSVAGDAALMYALLGQPKGKITFVDKIWYSYNVNNPLNDINRDKQRILRNICNIVALKTKHGLVKRL